MITGRPHCVSGGAVRAAGRAGSRLSPSALGFYWACQISEKNPRAENSPQTGPVAGPELSARTRSGVGGGAGPGRGNPPSSATRPGPTHARTAPTSLAPRDNVQGWGRGSVVCGSESDRATWFFGTRGQPTMFVVVCQCGLEKPGWQGWTVWLLVPPPPALSGTTPENPRWPDLSEQCLFHLKYGSPED